MLWCGRCDAPTSIHDAERGHESFMVDPGTLDQAMRIVGVAAMAFCELSAVHENTGSSLLTAEISRRGSRD